MALGCQESLFWLSKAVTRAEVGVVLFLARVSRRDSAVDVNEAVMEVET